MTSTTDDGPDLSHGTSRDALQALDFLAVSEIVGLAWLDEDLITRRRLGKLAEWIPMHEDICEACPPFLGLRREFLALQDEEGASLALPNVGLKLLADVDGPKFSIEVFWDRREARHLVVVHRLGAPSDLERQLVQEMRARRIAEENYRQAKARISEQQKLFDLFMDHAPAAIALFDREMRYIAATRRWTTQFGLDQEPLVGRSHYTVFPAYEEDSVRLGEDRERHRRCLEGRFDRGGVEPVARRDGATEWVQWDNRPWRRADDSIGGLIMFGDVVTEQVESRGKLEAKNRELEQVNGELEEFASIIAHDLRAPLRALREAARGLESGPDVGPSGEAGDCLRGIRHQTERMEAMLADLLEYSQIGRGSEVLRSVDLGALVGEIVASLERPPGIGIRLDGEWPVAETAVAPLDLILRNLIDNAFKHHDRDTGRVVVAIEDSGESWTFAVSDDGPGIDPACHEKIFEPFSKLGGRRQAPGSGIGLALVKKTIEYHGGSIEVVSSPERRRGATFRFHWMKDLRRGGKLPAVDAKVLRGRRRHARDDGVNEGEQGELR